MVRFPGVPGLRRRSKDGFASEPSFKTSHLVSRKCSLITQIFKILRCFTFFLHLATSALLDDIYGLFALRSRLPRFQAEDRQGDHALAVGCRNPQAPPVAAVSPSLRKGRDFFMYTWPSRIP